MEIVDSSMRETLRRLKAMAGGGVITRYSTRHVRIHQNPLMVGFVRPAGMNLPWGVIYGRALDAEPRISVASDPRKLSAVAEAMTELATYLLEQFGVANFSSHPLVSGTIKPEDMPQLWLADSANLSMLHNLGFAYFSDKAGDNQDKLAALSRLFNFLYEHSTVTGHQLVVNATELLNNFYVLPSDDHFSSNLASSLAWINTSTGIDQSRIAAIRALDQAQGVTLDREIENTLYAPLASIPDSMQTPDSIVKMVRQQIEPQLTVRWELLKEAWQFANADARQENTHVETLVIDSLVSFRRDFQSLELVEQARDPQRPRHPLTDNESIRAALFYLRALEADDKFITHMVHDDAELLGDLFYDGSAFMGEVVDIGPGDSPGEWLWRVKLNEKFGRLLKKREAESYCLIGQVGNPTIAISGFEKVTEPNGQTSYWVVEMTWSKKNSISFSFSTHSELNMSDTWKGQTLIFVPSFAENLHRDAQNVVEKSATRPGAWLTKVGGLDE